MADSNEQGLERLRGLSKNPEDYAVVADAVANKERDNGYYVVLGKTFNLPDEKYVKAFANAFHLDLYTAKQRLRVPAPRVMRRESLERKADEWASWLRAVKFFGFYFSDNDMKAHDIVYISELDSDSKELVFTDISGKSFEVPRNKVLCIVSGEVTTRRTLQKQSRGMLAGDIGHSIESRRLDSQFVIDIHLGGRNPTLRLMQNSFAYRSFYPDETQASASQIRRIRDFLLEHYKGVVYFHEFGKVVDSLGTSREIIGQSVQFLLNVSRPGLAGRTSTSAEIVEDSSGTFDLYSFLLRLETHFRNKYHS